MLWFKIKSWLEDQDITKLSKIQAHEITQKGSCDPDIIKKRKLPSYTRVIFHLTEKMWKEKEAKKSELIKIIKKISCVQLIHYS